MITGITEAISKHISCKCKFKFPVGKCNSNHGGITINEDMSVKFIINVENIIFGILLHVVARMEKIYLAFIDDSITTCNEIIEQYD